MSNPPLRDPQALARQRFFALAFLRFSGTAFAMLGIAMVVGKIPTIRGDTARYLGTFITLVGTFDVIMLPALLVRLWKRADRGGA